MTKLPKRPRDLNQLAKFIVDAATSETPQLAHTPEMPKGRPGGLIGGKARALKIDSDRRKAIASSAAQVRWSKAKTKEPTGV